MTSERVRWLKRAGLRAGFGVAVFAGVFLVAFPYGRVADLIVALASRQGVDVTIGGVGPALGLGLRFHDVEIATREADPKQVTRFTVDGARVYLSPLSLLTGGPRVSASVRAFDGDLDLAVAQSKAEVAFRLSARGVALERLPGVNKPGNIPVAGTLGLHVDLRLPGQRLAEASGVFNWTCEDCALGDGKAKLKVPSDPFLAEGVIVPKIRLGDFSGQIAVEKGLGKFQAVQVKSPDIDLLVEGEIRLADPPPFSYLNTYVALRPTEALLKREDKIKLLVEVIAAKARRSDGFFGFRLTGPLRALRAPEMTNTSPFARGAPVPPRAAPRAAAGAGAPPPPPSSPSPPTFAPATNAQPGYVTNPIQKDPPGEDGEDEDEGGGGPGAAGASPDGG